jgi:hypothetical protein
MRPAVLFALAALIFLSGCGSGSNTQSPSGGPPQGFPTPQITTGVVLEMYSETAGSLYESTNKYLFVCVTNFNRVDVFSTLDYHLISSIPVPAPMGIDIWPDNTQVVTGSLTPNLFVIDTSSLRIVRSVPVPAQGNVNPQLFFPTSVAQSSNGNTVLIMNNANAPDSTVLAEWDSKTGQFTYRNDVSSPLCIVSSADRTKTLIGSLNALSLYDASSNTLTASLNQYGCGGAIGANMNGTQFATSINSGGKTTLVLLDSDLNVQGQIPMGIPEERNMGIVYGKRGGYLYFIQYHFICNNADITTVDTVASAVVGSPISALGGECNSSLQEAPIVPIDENNVLYISVGGSIAVTPTSQTPIMVAPGWRSIAPPTGFSEVGAEVSIAENAPQIGYTIRNGGPESGGPPEQIYFYGEQYFNNLSATIGGASAAIDFAMNAEYYFTALSPWLETVEFQTPPGAAGLANVGVATPSGSTTANNAFIYVQERIVPVNGLPWQLIYDHTRQKLYISNATANTTVS